MKRCQQRERSRRGLRAWKEEHRVLGIRLEELNGRRHLTPEEEVERSTIRKKKLFLKDQMSSIARGPVSGPPHGRGGQSSQPSSGIASTRGFPSRSSRGRNQPREAHLP